MKRIEAGELLAGLAEIKDKRRQWGSLRHKLTDILFMLPCSVMCGIEDIDGMAMLGEERGAIVCDV